MAYIFAGLSAQLCNTLVLEIILTSTWFFVWTTTTLWAFLAIWTAVTASTWTISLDSCGSYACFNARKSFKKLYDFVFWVLHDACLLLIRLKLSRVRYTLGWNTLSGRLSRLLSFKLLEILMFFYIIVVLVLNNLRLSSSIFRLVRWLLYRSFSFTIVPLTKGWLLSF